jgi:hypothetical protein
VVPINTINPKAVKFFAAANGGKPFPDGQSDSLLLFKIFSHYNDFPAPAGLQV